MTLPTGYGNCGAGRFAGSDTTKCHGYLLSGKQQRYLLARSLNYRQEKYIIVLSVGMKNATHKINNHIGEVRDEDQQNKQD